MLRRIHDPERGASMMEYGTVIVLCAAILAAFLGSGLLGTITEGTRSAAQQLFGQQTQSTDENSSPTSDDGTSGPGSGNDPPPDDEAEGDDSLPDPGSGGSGQPQASPEDQGDDLWDSVKDRTERFLDGASDAVDNAVDEAEQSVRDARESAGRFFDDPVQWADDTVDDTVDGARELKEAVEDDPGQVVVDFFASDEAQQRCASGDRAGCAGMVVVENGEAVIPVWGWNRKRERLAEMAEDAREQNRRDERDESVLADACPFQNERNSFVPGTTVLLADGSPLPIEDVEIGDEVHALDPLTGSEGPREVTAVIEGSGPKTLVDISFTDTDGTAKVVTATDEHPFWVPDAAGWTAAIDLEPGSWLRASSGTWIQVTAVQVRDSQDQDVFNLTVDGLHTYYAGDGGAHFLVHNDTAPGRWSTPDCSPAEREYRNDPDTGVPRPVGQRENAQALEQRSEEIARGKRNTTVAVVRVYNTKTQEFEIWVSSSNPKGGAPIDRNNPNRPADYYSDKPPPSFRLESHERYIAGPPGHAEAKIEWYIYNHAPEYRIVEGGVNYNICQGEKPNGNCMGVMNDNDLTTGGSYPGTTYTSGKREFWWAG